MEKATVITNMTASNSTSVHPRRHGTHFQFELSLIDRNKACVLETIELLDFR
jgi:hypothetical protein